MKSLIYSILLLCIGASSCMLLESDNTVLANDEETERQLIAQAGFKSLTVVSTNASGDTLPKRVTKKFNEHGETIKLDYFDGAVTTSIKYDYTPQHQIATAKYYEEGQYIKQVAYQYGASGKLIATTSTSPMETITKQWVYDSEGNLNLVQEAFFAKMSPNTPKKECRTIYVYKNKTRNQKIQTCTEAQKQRQYSTNYHYNEDGRKVRTLVYDSDSPLVSENYWEYNQYGQIKYEASYIWDEAGGKTLAYQKNIRYNPQTHLVVQVTQGNATGAIVEQQFYEYQ